MQSHAHHSWPDMCLIPFSNPCQVGLASNLQLRALLDLTDQLIYEPCYDTLRTKQQLGYSVSSGTRLTHGVLGFCVTVVSAAYPPGHVEERIEAFLGGFGAVLDAMSEEEYERNRAALIANKLQRDSSLGHESDRHWEQVSWGARG